MLMVFNYPQRVKNGQGIVSGITSIKSMLAKTSAVICIYGRAYGIALFDEQ